jgi:hypothetical protein
MENNGGWEGKTFDIKIYKGRLANIEDSNRTFKYLLFNINCIKNEKSLHDLVLDVGYALGCLGMCECLGILDQSSAEKLSDLLADIETEMIETITRELKNGNLE